MFAAGRRSSPISSPEARQAYGVAAPVALGYSNGANIAAALLLLHPDVLIGAILLRAMAPLADPPKPDLSGIPVLILSGSNDPIVPPASAERLAEALAAAGARVEREVLPAKPRPHAGRHRARQERSSGEKPRNRSARHPREIQAPSPGLSLIREVHRDPPYGPLDAEDARG